MKESTKTTLADTSTFNAQDIEKLIETQMDFLDDKTTARDWKEIEEDLNRLYGHFE